MKKSLFRGIDRFELISCYVLCFLFGVVFDYSKSIYIESYFLRSFLQQFYDYQDIITILFSLIVVIFHYQMLQRRKTEVHCRILVGDTISALVKRYFVECLMMSGCVFAASLILTLVLGSSVIHIVYLFGIMMLYILLSSGMVRKFENI